MPVYPRLPQRKQPAGEAAAQAHQRQTRLPALWALAVWVAHPLSGLTAEPGRGLDPHTPHALEIKPRARAKPWAGAADQTHLWPPRSSARVLSSLGYLPAFSPRAASGPSVLRSFSLAPDPPVPRRGPRERSSKTRCLQGNIKGHLKPLVEPRHAGQASCLWGSCSWSGLKSLSLQGPAMGTECGLGKGPEYLLGGAWTPPPHEPCLGAPVPPQTPAHHWM